jgi:Spy/CpxP family protein refolding chaperone
MRVAIAILLLAIGILPRGADAQQHQHGQQPARPEGAVPMQGMMQMPMQGMMPGPDMILELRGPLNLTDVQVRRIETIRDRAGESHVPHAQAAMRAMQEAAGLLEAATPDISRYEAKLREAANHHVLAHAAMARMWLDVREVLTPEQRSNLRFGMQLMQQMMFERMQGMQGMRDTMRPGGLPERTNPPMHH